MRMLFKASLGKSFPLESHYCFHSLRLDSLPWKSFWGMCSVVKYVRFDPREISLRVRRQCAEMCVSVLSLLLNPQQGTICSRHTDSGLITRHYGLRSNFRWFLRWFDSQHSRLALVLDIVENAQVWTLSWSTPICSNQTVWCRSKDVLQSTWQICKPFEGYENAKKAIRSECWWFYNWLSLITTETKSFYKLCITIVAFFPYKLVL